MATLCTLLRHTIHLPPSPNIVSALGAQLNLPFARMVSAKAAVYCADAAALPAYTEQHDGEVAAAVELGGIRTFVAVPMLKEDKLIGALIVYRQEALPLYGQTDRIG